MEELNELLLHLSNMRIVFSEYRDLLHRKEKALVDGSFESLGTIIIDEEEKVLDLDRLEKEREEKVENLCRKLGIPENSTISRISQVLEEKEGTKLMLQIARFLELLQEVSFVHFNVQRMIAFQLKHLRILESTLLGKEKISTYNSKGDIGRKDSSGFFKAGG